MKIGSYEVYREDGICVLREEKSYETNKKPYGVKTSQDLYNLCTEVFEMHKLTCEKMLIICADNKAIPRAIFEIGGGSCNACCLSESALLTKILLTGYPCFFCSSQSSFWCVRAEQGGYRCYSCNEKSRRSSWIEIFRPHDCW